MVSPSPSSLRVVGQDDDDNSDLEGELEEDNSEYDPDLDLDPDSDSDSVPPYSSLYCSYYCSFSTLPQNPPYVVVNIKREVRVARIGITTTQDPRLRCINIISSAPSPHPTITIIISSNPIFNQAYIL